MDKIFTKPWMTSVILFFVIFNTMLLGDYANSSNQQLGNALVRAFLLWLILWGAMTLLANVTNKPKKTGGDSKKTDA